MFASVFTSNAVSGTSAATLLKETKVLVVVTGIEVKTSSSHVSVGGHGTQGGQQQPHNSELLSVDT